MDLDDEKYVFRDTELFDDSDIDEEISSFLQDFEPPKKASKGNAKNPQNERKNASKMESKHSNSKARGEVIPSSASKKGNKSLEINGVKSDEHKETKARNEPVVGGKEKNVRNEPVVGGKDKNLKNEPVVGEKLQDNSVKGNSNLKTNIETKSTGKVVENPDQGAESKKFQKEGSVNVCPSPISSAGSEFDITELEEEIQSFLVKNEQVEKSPVKADAVETLSKSSKAEKKSRIRSDLNKTNVQAEKSDVKATGNIVNKNVEKPDLKPCILKEFPTAKKEEITNNSNLKKEIKVEKVENDEENENKPFEKSLSEVNSGKAKEEKEIDTSNVKREADSSKDATDVEKDVAQSKQVDTKRKPQEQADGEPDAKRKPQERADDELDTKCKPEERSDGEPDTKRKPEERSDGEPDTKKSKPECEEDSPDFTEQVTTKFEGVKDKLSKWNDFFMRKYPKEHFVNKTIYDNNGLHCTLDSMQICPPRERVATVCNFAIGFLKGTKTLSAGFHMCCPENKSAPIPTIWGISEVSHNYPEHVVDAVKVFEKMIRAHGEWSWTDSGMKKKWRELFVYINNKNEMMLVITVAAARTNVIKEVYNLFTNFFKTGDGKEFRVTSVYVNCHCKTGNRDSIWRELLTGVPNFEIINGLDIRYVGATERWTNIYGLRMLCCAVEELLAPTKSTSVLEVFCYTGLIGFYLSKISGEVLGYDEPDIVKATMKSAARNDISNVVYFSGDPETEISYQVKNAKYNSVVAVLDWNPNLNRSVSLNYVAKTLRRIKPLRKMVVILSSRLLNSFPLKSLFGPCELDDGDPFFPVRAIPIDSRPYQDECTIVLLMMREGEAMKHAASEPPKPVPRPKVKEWWWNVLSGEVEDESRKDIDEKRLKKAEEERKGKKTDEVRRRKDDDDRKRRADDDRKRRRGDDDGTRRRKRIDDEEDERWRKRDEERRRRRQEEEEEKKRKLEEEMKRRLEEELERKRREEELEKKRQEELERLRKEAEELRRKEEEERLKREQEEKEKRLTFFRKRLREEQRRRAQEKDGDQKVEVEKIKVEVVKRKKEVEEEQKKQQQQQQQQQQAVKEKKKQIEVEDQKNPLDELRREIEEEKVQARKAIERRKKAQEEKKRKAEEDEKRRRDIEQGIIPIWENPPMIEHDVMDQRRMLDDMRWRHFENDSYRRQADEPAYRPVESNVVVIDYNHGSKAGGSVPDKNENKKSSIDTSKEQGPSNAVSRPVMKWLEKLREVTEGSDPKNKTLADKSLDKNQQISSPAVPSPQSSISANQMVLSGPPNQPLLPIPANQSMLSSNLLSAPIKPLLNPPGLSAPLKPLLNPPGILKKPPSSMSNVYGNTGVGSNTRQISYPVESRPLIGGYAGQDNSGLRQSTDLQSLTAAPPPPPPPRPLIENFPGRDLIPTAGTRKITDTLIPPPSLSRPMMSNYPVRDFMPSVTSGARQMPLPSEAMSSTPSLQPRPLLENYSSGLPSAGTRQVPGPTMPGRSYMDNYTGPDNFGSASGLSNRYNFDRGGRNDMQQNLSTGPRQISEMQQNLSTGPRQMSEMQQNMSAGPRQMSDMQQNISTGPRQMSEMQQNLSAGPRQMDAYGRRDQYTGVSNVNNSFAGIGSTRTDITSGDPFEKRDWGPRNSGDAVRRAGDVHGNDRFSFMQTLQEARTYNPYTGHH